MEYPKGLRFRPTEEEVVDDYLRPKNLHTDTSYVDGIISTVTICKFDPWNLPYHSRSKYKDHVWYFFSHKEKKYERGEKQMRTTASGYWKITGKPKDIIGNSQKIGHKRVLMFYIGKTPNGSKSHWVMHEYHLWSPDQMMMTYTICEVTFKGNKSDLEQILSSIPPIGNLGGLGRGTEGPPFELQNLPQIYVYPEVDELLRLFKDDDDDDKEWRSYLVSDEQMNTMCLQDDQNDYRPQNSWTGVFTDDNDSDLISATTLRSSHRPNHRPAGISYLNNQISDSEYPKGLRFRPTEEEIFDAYLRPKNLDTDTSRVDGVISTVTICKFDPWELPYHSRIKLKDHVWYFFGRKENKYETGEKQMRTTASGYWKITGKPKDIIGNSQKIGHKKVLMFYIGKTPNGSKTDWVMHEYHLWSPDQMMMTYTICEVTFKGNKSDLEQVLSLISSMNNLGELTGGTEVDALDRLFKNIGSDEFIGLLDDDDEKSRIVYMDEDRSNHIPKKAITGVFSGYSRDDTDSDSISHSAATALIQTCGSFGSSNHCTDHITDLQESPKSTIKLVSMTQEVSLIRKVDDSIWIRQKKSRIS